MLWIPAAVGSAVFAGLTAVLSKCGVKSANSDVATAVRTSVVLVFAWIIVFITGAYNGIAAVSAESWIFLALSGLATGASWICYFKALSIGPMSGVAVVDKSSVILSVLAAMIMFADERGNWWIKLLCLVPIAVGTYLMLPARKREPIGSGGVVPLSSKGDGTANTESNGSNAAADTATDDGQGENAESSASVNASANSATTVKKHSATWILFAVLSAVFAAATSILAKIGIKNVDSNLATALRTCVVLVVAWLIVPCRGEGKYVAALTKRDVLFLVLSGVATGASWLCYYYAIAGGQVSVVAPIDKLSVLITVLFGRFVLKEKMTARSWTGIVLLTAGTIAMAIWGR